MSVQGKISNMYRQDWKSGKMSMGLKIRTGIRSLTTKMLSAEMSRKTAQSAAAVADVA